MFIQKLTVLILKCHGTSWACSSCVSQSDVPLAVWFHDSLVSLGPAEQLLFIRIYLLDGEDVLISDYRPTWER